MRSTAFGCFVILGLASACSDGPVVGAPTGVGGAGGAPTGGAGVGDRCTSALRCRLGLVCNSTGVCEPGHTLTQGAGCTISDECLSGLQCIAGSCAPGGSGALGDPCRGDVDCMSGLRCGFVGLGLACIKEGSGDVGATCKTAADCFGGLACVSGHCATPPGGASPYAVSSWTGVACDAFTTNQVTAYFEVPGATNPPGDTKDFFRLPFPNDYLLAGGKIKLDGFPTPGADVLGYDPVKRYIDAIVASDVAWGTYPTVLFRFSGALDYDSLRAASAINWVDITPGAPERGTSWGAAWYASEGSGHYVCPPWLGVRVPQGSPLLPGHTYGIWLTTAAKDATGNPIKQSAHFISMLAANPPADPELKKAYDAFAPFRSYLSTQGIDPGTILVATVVTAGQVRNTMESLAAAAIAAPAPTAKSWVKCASGVTSPCPQADADRACGSGDPAYDEYHALVTLPIFQKGTEPYDTDGGDVQTSGPVRTEDVCMAITVPKGVTMPATGWPLVVFAHGTGGSFRSHVRKEVAGVLSAASVPGGGTVNFAVLGIDQVEHGPRRGSSIESPDVLFFNFANPAAARGNPQQGAADQISLARFAISLDVTAAETGGDAIKIDPTKIVFFGHSQGSTEGSLALPYADTYKAAVLSGNGASLMDALLWKTSPENVAAAVPLLIGDPDPATGYLNGGDKHPVLTLLQQWIDPSDPLNFAVTAGSAPPTGHTGKHLFQTYGLLDTYSPAATLQTYAIAARLDLAPPEAGLVVSSGEQIAVSQSTTPVSGNGPNGLTLAVRQYEPPSGDDGHFVVFDVPTANGDALHFLAEAASGATPSVP